MGEYLNGVKLGTCENLYYTTYKQLEKWNVSGKYSFLKVNSGYRFRFPFPDEKNVKIGEYKDFNRGWRIDIPIGIFETNHESKFLRTDSIGMKNAAPIGFSIDCPSTLKDGRRWEGSEFESYEIVQQKYVIDEDSNEPMLHVVLRCPYCGSLARASKEEATNIVEYIRMSAEKMGEHFEDKKKELLEIAETIINGYNLKKQ